MMKLLALLVVVLTVASAAADEVVQFLTASPVTACGDKEKNACQAYAVAKGNFVEGDMVKITYEIATAFADDAVCTPNTASGPIPAGKSCDTLSTSIFALIEAGATTTAATIEVAVGGAEILCPDVCLDAAGTLFTGICQPGSGSEDTCVESDASTPTVIGTAPLGAAAGALVTVECISGPCAPVVGEVVQFLTASPVDACGDTEANACQAYAVANGNFVEGDVVQITYEIATAFADDAVCTPNTTGASCDTLTTSIFALIEAGATTTAATIEVAVGGAEILCPDVCLDAAGALFTGICQPGAGSKDTCVKSDASPPTVIGTAPLGAAAGALVTVECISGPTCEVEDTTAAPEESEVVQCEAETEITSCGGTVDDPCQAYASATEQKYAVGDKLKITYDIPAAFAAEGDVCNGADANVDCDVYSKVVYVVIAEGKPTAAGVDVAISESAAHVLCPQNCLDSDSGSAVFAGICQVGESDTDGCAYPDIADPVDGPRNHVCKAALGSGADATVSVECVSGTCYQDEGSATALRTGVAALFASLLAVAMHVV